MPSQEPPLPTQQRRTALVRDRSVDFAEVLGLLEREELQEQSPKGIWTQFLASA